MKIVVTGGGTGGHVYPAIAIIESLKKLNPSLEFIYVGTERGIESKIVSDAKIPFEIINVEGLNKKISMKTFKSIYLLIKSLFSANKFLNKFKPSMVIGTGGYVSFPILFVAAIKKIPVFIHEQNAYPGAANKFLSRYATKLFVSFPDSIDLFKISKDKIVLSGNPVRDEFEHIDKEHSKKELNLDNDKKMVLSFGGSGGAKNINKFVIELAKELLDKEDIVFYHATGKRYYDEFNKINNLPNNLKYFKYIDNMPLYMGAADFVIARSGAITLAEISTLGLPSILVPSPNVANDHQRKNAKAFEKAKAAFIINENDFDYKKTAKQLKNILDNEVFLDEMGNNSSRVLLHNA
ncbi:MAG: undecaprenyldiphospho-muramoylpentapeptide beta-N-acetylglucosaminyltransferase, partial [Clostridiales bacterium]|nr:undecaprenyldiphospho-muramoylpentapeptide beta-N-acetylglucosaminyltransferase [Clostridiales bacterium]